jgi:hypothetical protein
VTALKYLASYIFRVAISNNRIVKLADDQVTFRYKDANTGKTQHCTVTAEEFIRRFLQHVLPKGFVKVRYYGFFSPTHRHLLNQIRQLLEHQVTAHPPDEPEARPTVKLEANSSPPDQAHSCPKCGRVIRLVETLQPRRRRPP